MDATAWGIEPGYEDAGGTWRDAPERTVRALLRSMGAESEEPSAGPSLWVTRADEGLHLAGRWELHTEQGEIRRVGGSVDDVPLGYHWLYNEHDGRGVKLIVSPGACHLPSDLHTWGWAVQLYALRSRTSWGIGDLGDLGRFGSWSARAGAGLVLLNPLHAATPVPPLQVSPYYPSSRCFRSPLYLRVEDVPGAELVSEDVARAATAARALNDRREIDRDAVLRLKMSALQRVWSAAEAMHSGPAFDEYLRAGGTLLERYATHCALAESFGPSWRLWPEPYRTPDSEDVAEFAIEKADRIRFHAWLQWLLDEQLEAAGRDIDLMQDLAVGVDPGGADAWIWQDVLARDVSVGAPPDEYNTQGQDWGVPPFDPWKLRAARYEPLIETLRAGFRHAGGLRVDHVMGLFRLFWVPAGASPTEGTYVRYPADDLLNILALESHRANAYVVGEDLGTVERAVRRELEGRNVLSYRLVWFEPDAPRSFPEQALGAVTTHDLPTVAGLWTGSDVHAQLARGMEPNVESMDATKDRLAKWTDLGEDAPVADVVSGTYRLLAEAPSAIVTATLEDALEVEERPNYPGTTSRTNWSLALPSTLEEIEADDRVQRIADTLNTR